jgi:hypothetical protein
MKVLIISPIEIFYEPRLRKAAVSFEKKGYEIHILICLRMHAYSEEYNRIKENNPNWIWHETDLRKQRIDTKLRWAISKVLHRITLKL